MIGFFDQKYLTKESMDILVFGMEIVTKERQHLRLPPEPNTGQKWQRLPRLGVKSFVLKFNFF